MLEVGGRRVLDGVSLHLAPGTRTALVGPSGAGKTTLIRAIAGLEAARGELTLGGRDLAGRAPHRRRVAVVFQEPRLLPNLSVVENVALGLRAAGAGRAARRARAGEMLGEVGLAELAERPTRGLSGGEQQRVALARALSVEPDLLLLDEPLAAVDAPLRAELRRLVVRLQFQRSVTMLIVTHDRAEAAEVGETVAVMLAGRIAQHDVPRAVFERPASEAVARFVGASNVIRGVVSDGRIAVAGGAVEVDGPDGAACLVVRPERVLVHPAGPLRMRVRESAYVGGGVRLTLEAAGCELEALVSAEAPPAAGELVGVELPSAALWRVPPELPGPARDVVPVR